MLFTVLLLLIFCISLEFNKEYIFTISKKSKLDCFCIRNIIFFTLVSIQRHPSNSSETVASEYYEQKSPLVGVKNVRN